MSAPKWLSFPFRWRLYSHLLVQRHPCSMWPVLSLHLAYILLIPLILLQLDGLGLVTGLLARGIRPPQGPCCTGQHNTDKDKRPCRSGIRTHDLSDQAIKPLLQTARPLCPALLLLLKLLSQNVTCGETPEFSSVRSGKYRDSTLHWTTTSSFHILPNSSLITLIRLSYWKGIVK
jgi:hypothetical protein